MLVASFAAAGVLTKRMVQVEKIPNKAVVLPIPPVELALNPLT